MLPPIINPGLREDTLENASALSPHLVQPSTDLPQMSRARGIDALLLNESDQSSTGGRSGTSNLSPSLVRNALRLAGVEQLQQTHPATPGSQAAEQVSPVAVMDQSQFYSEGSDRSFRRIRQVAGFWSGSNHENSSWTPSLDRYSAIAPDQHHSPYPSGTLSAPSTASQETSFRGRSDIFPYESRHVGPLATYEDSAPGEARTVASYDVSPPGAAARHRPQTSYESSLSRSWQEVQDPLTTRKSFSPPRYTMSHKSPAVGTSSEHWVPTMTVGSFQDARYLQSRPELYAVPGESIPASWPPLTDLERRCEDVSLLIHGGRYCGDSPLNFSDRNQLSRATSRLTRDGRYTVRTSVGCTKIISPDHEADSGPRELRPRPRSSKQAGLTSTSRGTVAQKYQRWRTRSGQYYRTL